MPKANKIKGRTPDKNRHIIQWRIWDGGGGVEGACVGENAMPSKYHVSFSDETEI